MVNCKGWHTCNGISAFEVRSMMHSVALVMLVLPLGVVGSEYVWAETPEVNVAIGTLELSVSPKSASASEPASRVDRGGNVDLVSPASDAAVPTASKTAVVKSSAGEEDPAAAADTDVASSSAGPPPVQRSVAASATGSGSPAAAQPSIMPAAGN